MKIIASNFKTNHTRATTAQFMHRIDKFMTDDNITQTVYLFPPSTALDSFKTNQNLHIGAQNCHWVKSGSYTGEIGTQQLDEFGIKTILIGHSERRHTMGENQKDIAKKFNYFKALAYRIIYCVGEPLEQKQAGLSSTLGYIQEQFDGIDLTYDKLILAYEPVWAIGTGVSCGIDDIATIHKKLAKKTTAPILYGGSVKQDNIKEIINIPNVDGALIGTASWVADDFVNIIKSCN